MYPASAPGSCREHVYSITWFQSTAKLLVHSSPAGRHIRWRSEFSGSSAQQWAVRYLRVLKRAAHAQGPDLFIYGQIEQGGSPAAPWRSDFGLPADGPSSRSNENETRNNQSPASRHWTVLLKTIPCLLGANMGEVIAASRSQAVDSACNHLIADQNFLAAAISAINSISQR